MAYQSLYRKYRPQRFAELVGQEHVTHALSNAVREGRVGHAYLFSGPRGTGKTTTARIFAKALNCTNLGDDGEPCGACENCVMITRGQFFDIRELDAASNRGIDDIREIIDSTILGLAPNTRAKLYVLDEVHMLTESASNALLKTLEDAPEHVVFVLATTNPERVLPTVRGRTQHFEFTLLPTDAIAAHLGDIATREGLEADPEALALIAGAAEGSVRDALSLLDQAAAHGDGRIESDVVAGLFGGSRFEARVRILEAIAAEDSPGALVALGELLEAGHEARRAAEDLLATARDAFLLVAAAGRVRIDAPPDEHDRLRSLARDLGNAALVRVVETLGQAVTDMRGTDAADPRLVLEVALVRLSRRDAGPPLQTIIERLERLERAGGSAPSAVPDTEAPRGPRRTVGALRRDAPPAPAPAPAAPAPPAPAPAASAPESGEAAPLDIDEVIVAWGAILPELPVATRHAAQAAQPLRVDGDVLVFGVPPAMLEAAKPRFRKEADAIRSALAAHVGRNFKFNLVPAPEFSLGGSDSAAAPQAPPLEESVDLSEAVDAEPSPDPAGVGLLRDELGATVVEERPRDAS